MREVVIGQQFYRLTTILSERKKMASGMRTFWVCRCECGKIKSIYEYHLKSGAIKSCGCLSKEITGNLHRTHGQSKSKLYDVWCKLKSRCLDEKDPHYHNYGGRGISVCSEWLSYEPFHTWAMDHGYSNGLTIERTNNNGNYKPGNCIWATRKVQGNNNRRNRKLTFQGQTMNTEQWAEILEVKSSKLRSRLHRGWTIEKTLNTPLGKIGRPKNEIS